MSNLPNLPKIAANISFKNTHTLKFLFITCKDTKILSEMQEKPQKSANKLAKKIQTHFELTQTINRVNSNDDLS